MIDAGMNVQLPMNQRPGFVRALCLIAIALLLPACGKGGGGGLPPGSHGTWEARVDRPAPGSVGDAQEVKSASSGNNVYAVWIDSRNGLSFNGSGGVWFNRSTNGGVTWQATDFRIDRAGGSGFALGVQIVCSGAHVWVVWQDQRNGYSDIYLTHSSDNGVTWPVGDVRIDTDAPGAGDSLNAQIAVQGSTVYVVWIDTRIPNLYEIRLNRSLNDGATWLGNDVRLDDSGTPFGGPQISASGNRAVVVWSDLRNGSWNVFMNRTADQGTTWLASDVKLDHTGPGQNAGGPSVAVSGAFVNVAWIDNRNGKYDIYTNRSTDGGSTWAPTDVRLDTDLPGAGDSIRPQLVASGATVYACWEDGRSGSSDIQQTVASR